MPITTPGGAESAEPAGPTRPAIVIDIDGVLNPFLRCSPPYCRCHRRWRRYRTHPDGVLCKIVLNPGHGRQLRELAAGARAELVWGTMWQDNANLWVGPKLGLPELPWVPIPPLRQADPRAPVSIGAWKARHIADWAAGRPFVWFDDEADVPDQLAALADVRPLGPYLAIQVDQRVGLTSEHLARARDWLTFML